MNFADWLLEWYYQNKRELPWRDIQDPYKIWLSEIMLQQTRIQQVYEYYEKFIHQWKTIQELANASEEEVFKAWEGLGYYSRAKNLHQTAKIITQNFNGIFPNNYQELQKLPGIGSYTSRAIASFAFGQSVVSLDGNGFRVITRVLDIDLPIQSNKNQKIIQNLADELLQNASSKDFNYALMDLGNLICKPQNPLCNQCPVQNVCLANKNQTQNLRPVKIKELKRTNDYLVFYWIEKQNQIAIFKKNQSYWKGLYTFPYEKLEPLKWEKIHHQVIYKTQHVLTHKDLYIKILKSDYQTEGHWEWVDKKELLNKPFPKPLQKFIEDYLKVINFLEF